MDSKKAFRAGSWLFLGVLGAGVACGGDVAPGEDPGSVSESVTGVATHPLSESAAARAALDGARSACTRSPIIGDAGIPDAALDASPAPSVAAMADGGDAPGEDSVVGPSLVDHFESRGASIVPIWKTPEAAGTKQLARVLLPARSGGAFQLVDVDTAMQLRVSMRHANDVPAEVGNGHVVYRGADASGADVIHRLRHDGTEDYVSFKTVPASRQVTYDVTLDSHVAGLRLVSNSLEFLDSSGTPRLRIAPPEIIGADCNRAEAELSVEGCAFDSNPAGPWGRPVTSPRASQCQVHIKWKDGVA